MRGAPGSPGSLSLAMTSVMPPVSPAFVSPHSIALGSSATQPHPAPLLPVDTIVAPQTTAGNGGFGGKRAAAEILSHGDLNLPPENDSEKQPRTDGPGTSASSWTGGRRKGQLTQQASSCHGCRNTKPTGQARHACQGGHLEDDEMRECNYWLCHRCMGKWTGASGGQEGFWCCLYSGKEWCPCANR